MFAKINLHQKRAKEKVTYSHIFLIQKQQSEFLAWTKIDKQSGILRAVYIYLAKFPL